MDQPIKKTRYRKGPVSREEFDKVMERFDSIDVQQKTTNDLLASVLDILMETRTTATHKHIGTLLKMRGYRG